MKKIARRWMVLLLSVAVSGVLIAAAIPAVGEDGIGSSGYVVVEMSSPGAASYTGGVRGIPATHPQNGRFDPDSQAYQSYRKHLENEHANFRAALGRHAPSAEIVREYYVTANAVAVQLNGTKPSDLRRLNGVKNVWDSGLYYPTMDKSLGLIDPEGSASLGDPDAGEDIRVAVIDSGILPDHEFFVCKEVEFGGVYFSGVTGVPAWAVAALIAEESNLFIYEPHGTHVAGTVGGCVTEIHDEASVWHGTTVSGVAPGVTLVDYNVFPALGAGLVAFGGSAFSHDIAAAIEDAVLNGDHVINMSLGGGAQGPRDFLAEASNGAAAAGVVVVTSAGNEGPGAYTVGSPGTASGVITVAASTNSRGMGVTIDVVGGPDYRAVPGEFDDFGGIPYDLVVWPGSDDQACSTNDGEDLVGEVVIVSRGTCSFSQKVANAKEAGAGGVIVYNNTDEPPFPMGKTDGFDDDLPAVMVSKVDGQELAESPVTATISAPEIVAEDPNLIADFSSRGPAAFTGIVKPDVTAPGVNILSSVFTASQSSGWELYDGTSMASPHVAGAAAVLLAAGMDPAHVKSALATTATDRGFEVWEQGSGLINVGAALGANAFFHPTNASFGVFQGKKPAFGSISITITTEVSCGVGAIGGPAAVYIDAAIVDGTLVVDFNGGRDVHSGRHSGLIIIDCGDQTHSIPYGVVVDRKG